jgi:hypothetical protein
MPTTNRDRAALGVVAAVVAVVGVVLLLNLGSPPQMGADEEVFRTVDALFTALTGRREPQLDQCERRLREYREAGKLPPKAAKTLDTIIATARAGKWRSAAERLYEFMKGQKREGAGTPRKNERATKG